MTVSAQGPLFRRIADPATLRAAWEKVRGNGGAAGGDGVTIERFGLVAEAQIERLSRALLNGAYRPGPSRRVWIPKRGGGERPLDIPCISDRVVQAAATLVLDPILDEEMEPSSYAYRKGRSVAQAVARVASLRREGYTHVVDGDIERYFESVPHELLMDRFERYVDDGAVQDLLWLWLETGSATSRGLPQGAPISPLLANLYLDSVDEAIETRGARLVRFADDFLILCKSEAAAGSALERMAALLVDHGLRLNPDKTRITSFAEGFRFLGHVFVRSLLVKEIADDPTPGEDAIADMEAMTARAREIAAEDDEDDDGAVAETGEPEGEARLSRRIVPTYVVEPGRRLEARGERLRLVDDLNRISDLAPRAMGRIELGPGTDATLAALDLAAAHDVEVLRINGEGEVLGRWERTGPERAKLHLAQAALVLDPVRRGDLARMFAEGRAKSMRANLKRLNRERRDSEIDAVCASMARPIRRFRIVKDPQTAMGLEGEITALYWPALGRALPDDWPFRLRRRRRRPDGMNLILDVMSGMLARDVRAAILRVGLHPGFGLLHEARDGGDALVYDLMEEFRAPLVEASAVAAVNRRAVRVEHLVADSQSVRLSREGWRAVIKSYESWLDRPIRSPATGRRLLWRGFIEEQARAFAALCLDGTPYEPYAIDY